MGAMKYAIELAEEEEGWKVEKEQGEATVKTKKNKDDRKVWLCTATVNVNPKLLFDKMKDVDNLTSWNTTLTQSKILKTGVRWSSTLGTLTSVSLSGSWTATTRG